MEISVNFKTGSSKNNDDVEIIIEPTLSKTLKRALCNSQGLHEGKPYYTQADGIWAADILVNHALTTLEDASNTDEDDKIDTQDIEKDLRDIIDRFHDIMID